MFLQHPTESIPMLLVIVASLTVSTVYWVRIIKRRGLMIRRKADRFSFLTLGLLLMPALLTTPTMFYVEVAEVSWPGIVARYISTVLLLGAAGPIVVDGLREAVARLRLRRMKWAARRHVATMNTK